LFIEGRSLQLQIDGPILKKESTGQKQRCGGQPKSLIDFGQIGSYASMAIASRYCAQKIVREMVKHHSRTLSPLDNSTLYAEQTLRFFETRTTSMRFDIGTDSSLLAVKILGMPQATDASIAFRKCLDFPKQKR